MKNNKLKRLADLKSLELDEEFLSSSKPSELRGRYSHIQVEAAEEEILLNDFDSMMADLLSSDFETPTQLDGMMAVKLHKALPIAEDKQQIRICGHGWEFCTRLI